MMTSLLMQGCGSHDKSLNEEWKAIPKYEGIYEASNLGRIRTAEDKTTHSILHGERHWKQRILKPKSIKAKGHRKDLRVTLWKDKKPKDHLVARLVAMAWIDGYKDGMTVNHKDGNFLNNNVENLEWLTLADNIRMGFQTGLYKKLQRKVCLIRENGERLVFDSMSACSVFLGRQKGYVSSAIAQGRKFVYSKSKEAFIVKKERGE